MFVGRMTAKGFSSRKIWMARGTGLCGDEEDTAGLLIYQEGTQGCTEMVGVGFPSRSFQVRTQQAVFVVKSFIEPPPPLVWSKLY